MTTLHDEVSALVEALEWYGEEILTYAITQEKEPRSAAHEDKGKRAREALTRTPVLLTKLKALEWQPIETVPACPDKLLVCGPELDVTLGNVVR
jgi:hypothetical protein